MVETYVLNMFNSSNRKNQLFCDMSYGSWSEMQLSIYPGGLRPDRRAWSFNAERGGTVRETSDTVKATGARNLAGQQRSSSNLGCCTRVQRCSLFFALLS